MSRSDCLPGWPNSNVETEEIALAFQPAPVWSAEKQKPAEQVYCVYQRRPSVCCCILAGDTDCGGLDMLIPVLGLTMGIALRIRVAAGWCSFSAGWPWYPVAAIYGLELELREKPESGDTCWDWGEASGEPLDSEERSDADEWMEIMSTSVSRLGQNSRSSSRSKERPASKRSRKLVTAAASSSFLTLRNCLWEFCDKRGARRPRPPWCEFDAGCGLAAVGCWWVL